MEIGKVHEDLIDVGGHRLYYRTSGEGSPTVIIEPGTGASSELYSLLEQGINKFTRVILYDRSGLGRSEPGSLSTDGPEVARQLHTLLQRENIPGPFILLGHSFGGIYIRHFAARFSDEVAGLIFVDSSHPEQNKRLPFLIRSMTNTLFRLIAAPGIGPTLVKLIYKSLEKDLQNLPPERMAEFQTNLKSSKHINGIIGEYKMITTSLAQTARLGPEVNKPIVVFSATLPKGNFIKGWHVLQDEIAAISTNSTHYKIEGAKHFTLISDPKYVKLIVESLRKMVLRLRNRSVVA